MTMYPLDEKDAYKTLHDGIVAYAGALTTQQQNWLKSAINEAAQFPTLINPTSDRLFSDPMKVAQVLIEEKQSLQIIIASLIYSRIKKEQLSEDAYKQKLEDIMILYSNDIARMTQYALQEAYTDIPMPAKALQDKYDLSDENRKLHFAAIREEKKIHPGAKAKPQQTLKEKAISTFIRYVDSRNPLPQSQAIRIADRWASLQEIDPDAATDKQKKRIEESWQIHAQMANNHGLRRFYYDFGNLYIRSHFPQTYKAILALNEFLEKTMGVEGDVLHDVTEYISEKLEKAGLVRRDNLDDIKGGFYIKKRLQKSVISTWTKLIGDGIDPEDYFKRHAKEIADNPRALMQLLLQAVFGDGQLKDAFAFTVIVDQEALIDLEHIKPAEPNKPWHAHKNACEWMARILDEGTAPGGQLHRQHYASDPARTKDYFTNPRGRRGYRSLHIGKTKKVVLPLLDKKTIFPVPIEIILRTALVHIEAENGKWAHNRFKSETIRGEAAWEDAQTLITARKKVYVFTPAGEIFEFDKGTRVRDVAFQINQDLGLYCKGATAYRGYKSWRDDDRTELQALVRLDPDALVDDINGCTIKIEADVPQAVKDMRKDKVIGYPHMPPGYTKEKLHTLINHVTTDLSRRKINTILNRLGYN